MPLIPVNQNEIDPRSGVAPINRTSKTSEEVPLTTKFKSSLPIHIGRLDDNITRGINTDSYKKYVPQGNVFINEGLDVARAVGQPVGAKAVNSIVGGVGSGVLTALQDVGYLADVENNVNRVIGTEYAADNWFTELMQEGKEGISEGMPIYRKDSSKVFDWDDPAFYFDAFKGVIDSAVGFGLPGLGVTKAIGAAQRAIRVAKGLELLKKSKQTAQIFNSVASGYITNFMEGKTMAVEQYENSLAAMKDNLYKSVFNELKIKNATTPIYELQNMARIDTDKLLAEGKEDEFKKIAGEEANKFINRNRIFALTDMISLHGLYKGVGFTRNEIKEKGIKAWGKSFGELSEENMLLQGSKEYLEEVGQNVLQMEGQYQSNKRAGLDKGEMPDDLMKRAYKFASSDQAQLEGLMGFLGGGPQRIMMEAMSGGFSAKARAEYKQKYDEQQDIIKSNTDFLNKHLGDYAKAQAMRNEAIAKGEDNLADVIKNKMFIGIVGRNLQAGTTESLERSLQDIVNGVSEDERLRNGWDENYRQQAMEQLGQLKTLEKEYLKHSRYNNQLETFLNRQTRKLFEEDRKSIDNRLMEVRDELELQKEKNPDLINDRDKLKRDYDIATEEIKFLDEKFKIMTSPEYQYKILKDRKDMERGQKAAIKEIENRLRNSKKKDEARARKENVGRKEEALAQEETVKQPKETKDADVDVSKVSNKETDDIDVSALVNTEVSSKEKIKETGDIDVNQLTKTGLDKPLTKNEPMPVSVTPETEASKQEFGKHFSELNQMINSLGNVQSNSILTEESDVIPASNILTDDERLSREQKMVGILQNMVESAKKIKGKDKVDFDDLMSILLEMYGTETIKPVFNHLQALWLISGNEQKKHYATLKEYLTPTADEKNESEADKQVRRLADLEQYTGDTETDINESIKQIERQIGALNNPEDDESKEYDYRRVRFGANIIAYLSRKYDQIITRRKISREDIDNTLNEKLLDKKILDPEIYKVGTEITLRLEDVDSVDDYISGTDEKQISKWGTKKDRWRQLVKDGLITEKDYDQKFMEEVPIAIYAGEQKIGYIHTTEWIKESNVLSEDIEADKSVNKSIRRYVVTNKEFKTKISKRTAGYLIKASKGAVVTEEAIPNKNIKIVVAKNGVLYENRNTPLSGDILNKTVREGVMYAVVPVPDGNIGVPLLSSQLKNHENIVQSMRRAIEIFYTRDESAEAKAFVDAIFKTTGLNITSGLDMSEYLRFFVNIYNTNNRSLRDFLKEDTSVRQSNNVYLTTFVRTGNDLQFEIGRGGMHREANYETTEKPQGVQVISRAIVGKLSKGKVNEILDKITDYMRDMYFQANLDSINNNKQITILDQDNNLIDIRYEDHLRKVTSSIFLGLNIADEGQTPKYVYTIQPVISFDYSGITEEKKIGEQEVVVSNKDTELAILTKTPEQIIEEGYKRGYFDEKTYGEYKVAPMRFLENFENFFKAAKINDPDFFAMTSYAYQRAIGNMTVINYQIKKINEKYAEIEKQKEPLVYGDAIADIERRRQEELKRYDERDARSIESTDPNAESTKNTPFRVGKKVDVGHNLIDIKQVSNATNYDGREDAYTIITKVHSPMQVNEKGEMIKVAVVDIMLFNNKEDAEKHIREQQEKIKRLAGQKQKEINAKYDAELQKEKDLNKIQIKDKEEVKIKPVYKKRSHTSRQNSSDDLSSDMFIGLSEDEVQKVREKSEVKITEKGKVTGIIISDFNSMTRQQEVVDYIQKRVVESVFSSEEGVKRSDIFSQLKKEFEDDLSDERENLKIATEANELEDIKLFEREIKNFEVILNNWNTLTGLVDENLTKINEFKIEEDEEAEVENENVDDPETNEGDAQTKKEVAGNEGWIDATYQKDPSVRLSGKIKEFLSGITMYQNNTPEVDENGVVINKYGTPARTYFGAVKSMSIQEVYNTLQRLTPNLKSDYHTIIQALEKHKEAYPFVAEVIDKLEASTRDTKYKFVSAMTNHYVDMKFIMFTPTDEGFELTEYDSNASELTQVIMKDWYQKMLQKSAVPVLENPEELIIPEDMRKLIMNEYESWKKKTDLDPTVVRTWLSERFGIELSDRTWKDIVDGKFRSGRGFVKFKDFVNFNLCKYLYNNIKKRGSDSVATGNRIIDGTAIKNLARLEARYTSSLFTNSHRTGVKTVYSYSHNKYLVNRVRELKERDEKGFNAILEELKHLSFNGKSEWLNAMYGEDQEKNRLFLENFDYWILSLEPLKKVKTASRDNREFHKLSEAEIEVVKIGMLQAIRDDKAGAGQRIIRVLYPTTSDKTTVLGLRVVAQDLKLNMNAEIGSDSVQKIVDAVIIPEINRIVNYQKMASEKKPNIKLYDDGAQRFIFFPEMNKVEGLFDEDGMINPDVYGTEMMDKIRAKAKEYFDNLVSQKLENWKENGIGEADEENGNIMGLSSAFMEGTTAKDHNPIRPVDEKFRVKAAASDMVFQYLIANAEIAKLFTGDPALYYTKSSVNDGKKVTDADYDFVADAKETYVNIGKRLAADIAPGEELANSETDTYVQAFGADFPAKSAVRYDIAKILDGSAAVEEIKKLEENYEKTGNGRVFKKALKKYNSGSYFYFDSTDAQEYTTWQEHLKVLRYKGDISDRDFTIISELINNNKELDEAQLNLILQPLKPVYVDNIIEPATDVERRLYIKSSSFPLIPQLTRGTQLENLRLAMQKQGIARFAYSTAVKVGNIKNPINIFDKDGNILPADQIDFTGRTLTLKRKGFRIQQTIPISKVTEITKVTQASKNLLVNMLDVTGFKVSWYNNGESITGAKLQEIYHEKYGRLHKLEKEKLLDELLEDDGETINRDKLRRILLREVKERGYPISDRELIELDEELDFLAFSPSSNKYESLLNSIVTNRVIRITMPGKSFVLGSEEGFKGNDKVKVLSKEEISKNKSIIFTKNYDPKVGLKPAREENGKRYPSQAIIPWKLKDGKGKKIDMSKYIKDGLIDTTKIPEEVLTLFGMRIPNQGPNSQALIEVVGFLPEMQGDLIIATKDFVVQMGSDFDVDKLYTYMYTTYVDKEGNIKVEREIKSFKDGSTNESNVLKNEIIDVHHAIHENPDPRVQAQIASPIGVWKLQDYADEIYAAREKRQEVQATSGKRKMFTGLSDQYQREKFKNASMGKSGVGVFSLDSMFNAIAQGKDLVLTERAEDGSKVPVTITIGNKTSNGDLSSIYDLDGKTYKSDIIAGYQSAAVDNEKLQILDKLNINTHTFKTLKLLNQLGFGDEAVLFVAQDIIIDYVKELEKLGSSLTDYAENRIETARANVLAMSKYSSPTFNIMDHAKFATSEATLENLMRYISEGPLAPNYKNAQIAILNKFIVFDSLGQKIQQLQSTINPDSAGIGKSVMESEIKEDQVYKLLNSDIRNAANLVGDMLVVDKDTDIDQLKKQDYTFRYNNGTLYAIKPKTINGFAIVHGLFTNNDLWETFFPYKMDSIQQMFRDVEVLSKADDMAITTQATRRKEVWNEFKSYLFTKKELGLYDTDPNSERQRLLYDVWENQEREVDGNKVTVKVRTHMSLASIIQALQKTQFGKRGIIARLEADVKINGKPSLVKYNASSAEGMDEGNIYASVVDMLVRTDATGASPNVGTFNGRVYTAREIAQELILYAYITGGIQEAIQFVKYVPASYLHTLPLFGILSNFKSFEDEFTIAKPDDDSSLYMIHPFVLQYFQHNPKKLKMLRQKELKNSDAKNADQITEFTIDDDTKVRIGIGGRDGILLEPPLITTRSQKSESGVNLFRFDPTDKKYKKIDTLGTFGVSEYNYNNGNQRSSIPNNRNLGPVKKGPAKPVITKESVKAEDRGSESKPTDLINDVITGKVKTLVREDGKEVTKELLNSIVLTSSVPYHTTLAKELLNRIDNLPKALRFQIGQRGTNQPYGSFFYSDSVDGVAKMNTLYLNSDRAVKTSREKAEQVVLHELIHGITGYKLLLYEFENALKSSDQELAKKAESRIETLRESIPNIELTSKDREVIKSINILFNQLKNKLFSDPIFKEGYDNFIQKIRAKDVANIKSADGSKYYGLSDMREFVTMALTDKGFQDLLNNTKLDSGKTFLQALKERIIELLKSMGFEVKQGSALEQSLYYILDVLDIQKPQVQQRNEVDKLYESLGNKTQSKNVMLPKDFDEPMEYDGKTFWSKLVPEARAHWENSANPIIIAYRGNREKSFLENYKSNTIGNPFDWQDEEGSREQQGKESTKKFMEWILTGNNFGNANAMDAYRNALIRDFSSGKWRNSVIFYYQEKGYPTHATVIDYFANIHDWGINELKNLGKELSAKVDTDNTLLLKDGRVITFNNEQSSALVSMKNWFESKEQYFTLSGFAGTGKTTIVKKALETFLKNKAVAVSAPTHRAKRVIAETTKRNAVTLHSLLGLRPDVDLADFDPDNPEFASAKPPIIANYSVIIIDEASMINKRLLNMLLKEAGKHGTKLIFMGDQAQIPPVGENISEVFTHSKITSKAHLTKVERQADGNPLFKVYDAIRGEITAANDRFSHKTIVNNQGEGIIFEKTEKEFSKRVIDAFKSQEYKDNPEAFKVIAYTNKEVHKWNKIVREAIMGTNVSFLEVGDTVTGYDTVSRGMDEVLVENSADYRVVSKSQKHTSSEGIEGFEVILEMVTGEKTRIFVIDRNRDNIVKYINKLEEYRAYGKKYKGSAWNSFYKFKAENIIFGDVVDENGRSITKKQLDYGYASTVHKIQGGTVKTIFVDENNIDTDRFWEQRHVIERKKKGLPPLTKEDVDTERNKIKYVAFSRPTLNAVVLSNKTEVEQNSYVQPAKPEAKKSSEKEPEDGNIDLAAMMREEEVKAKDDIDVNKLNDTDSGIDINKLRSNASPQELVSDEELDEFIKNCKGL